MTWVLTQQRTSWPSPPPSPARSSRCQERTIRAIPVESMKSHSVRSMTTWLLSPEATSPRLSSSSGAVFMSSSPRTVKARIPSSSSSLWTSNGTGFTRRS